MRKHILLFVIVAMLFTGCISQRPTELNTTMHSTTIYVPAEKLSTKFDADLQFSVTENAEGTSDVSVHLDIPDVKSYILSDIIYLDFQHEKNSFELIYADEDLPYYCIKATIFDPTTDAFSSSFMAIDTEKEYMIFSFTDVTYCYVVASSDPDVDPYAIEEHFERFIELQAEAQRHRRSGL